MRKHFLVGLLCVLLAGSCAFGQSAGGKILVSFKKLPDTGQTTDYTALPGEDADYTINAPSYTVRTDGTVIDNVTGLIWQQTDGGEMTWEQAIRYCDSLTLAGYSDWRLPTGCELFGLLNHDKLNPALDITVFTKTAAEYWWSSERRVDDTTKVWSANAGGGIGPHPKNETVSAGSTRRFHVRAVRMPKTPAVLSARFIDNGNGTVTDRITGLIWQKIPSATAAAWTDALTHADTLTQAGYADWRLPNIKELQSLNDPGLTRPSIDKTVFSVAATGRLWSSTTQFNTSTKAWNLDIEFGIVSYELKTAALNVLCVRGRADGPVGGIGEVTIPGGTFEMGDHFGFVDPSHPSDELPVHTVTVSSFLMSATEMTVQQCCDLLSWAMARGRIEVRGGCVFLAGEADTLCFLNQFASYASIGWNGTAFSVADFRAQHPIVGIQWKGAAAFCNWLSLMNGLQECYTLGTGVCDFTKNGYRLPTEAEWEYAGRGGHISPYFIYPSGNTIDVAGVNLPASGDPYETGAYPNTTPAGFYDGQLKRKADFSWPGAAATYQTSNGANSFGLYDMQGNVWEFVNDWYGQNYYASSPAENPKGPTTGFIMPDGKPYRGMRGGNWYNGLVTNGVNDGHSRVANRNPSYYRGPQDPYHPWYHIGFRVARSLSGSTGIGGGQSELPSGFRLHGNYPNPFNPATTILYTLGTAADVTLVVYDLLGREAAVVVNAHQAAGAHTAVWNAAPFSSGAYFCRLTAGGFSAVHPMLLVK